MPDMYSLVLNSDHKLIKQVLSETETACAEKLVPVESEIAILSLRESGLVEIQHRFERLAVMGDDEYRGSYIEVPRPTPEEWGDAEELIASGEYDSSEAFLADWLAFNPMETRWFHVTSSRYGDSRSIRITDRKRTRFIFKNDSRCTDTELDDTWCRDVKAIFRISHEDVFNMLT